MRVLPKLEGERVTWPLKMWVNVTGLFLNPGPDACPHVVCNTSGAAPFGVYAGSLALYSHEWDEISIHLLDLDQNL